jgi:hypothetical protein
MKATQGRRLIAALKRKGHTTMEMLALGISVAPWKRIAECLRPDEQLVKRKNERGLTVYRVVNATRWTV